MLLASSMGVVCAGIGGQLMTVPRLSPLLVNSGDVDYDDDVAELHGAPLAVVTSAAGLLSEYVVHTPQIVHGKLRGSRSHSSRFQLQLAGQTLLLLL